MERRARPPSLFCNHFHFCNHLQADDVSISLASMKSRVLLPLKAFVKFKNVIRFHRQAFIICKNGENNLKIPIEIIRQKLTLSNVILGFLDHLKPRMFFVGQPCYNYQFSNLITQQCFAIAM